MRLRADARTRIIFSLSDGGWHRYSEIVEKTGSSTATVTKHLKEMGGILVEKLVDRESGEYPYPTYYRIIPSRFQFEIQKFIKSRIYEALKEELKHVERAEEEYCGGIDVSLRELQPRSMKLEQIISKEIESRPLLVLEELSTRLSYSRYSIDPLDLEQGGFPSLLGEWMVNWIFIMLLTDIGANLTPETSYKGFLSSIEKNYNTGTMFLFRYRSDEVFDRLKEEGFFKKYFEQLKEWIKKDLESKEYISRGPSYTEILGVRWGKLQKKEIEEQIMKGGASDEEAIELYRKFWERRLILQNRLITQLRTRLREEIMALVKIAENYTYYTLLSNFNTIASATI